MIRTSRVGLSELFTNLGIVSGGTVMIHSALFSLGIIEGGIEGFYKQLLKHLGEDGTIVVPTFTSSFRRGEVFDVRYSQSSRDIGVLSEFIRLKTEAVRSADPLFSMAAIGPRAEYLMQRSSASCFGGGSVYERLFFEDVQFIGIGITYSTGLSGFMHIERVADVPYRLETVFSGVSRDRLGNEYPDYAIHFSRNEEVFGATRMNRELMGEILERKGVSVAVQYGYGRHISLRGAAWKDVVLEELMKDPFAMLDKTQYPNGVIPKI